MKRILVPFFALVLGIIIALSFATRGDRDQPPITPAPEQKTPADALAEATGPTEAPQPAPKVTAEAPVEQVAEEAVEASPAPVATPDPVAGLRIAAADNQGKAGDAQLGSADPTSDYKLRANLSRWGAGVSDITLATYRHQVDKDDRYVIAPPLQMPGDDPNDPPLAYPMAARAISINAGPSIDLATAAWTLETSSPTEAVYTISLEDAQGQPIAKITRRYALAKDSFDITLDQSIDNLTAEPMSVVFRQYLQGDVYLSKSNYLGDQRKFVTGYFDPQYDPAKSLIFVDDAFRLRQEVIDSGELWPNPDIKKVATKRLAWLTTENRYFALITYPRGEKPAAATSDLPYFDEVFGQFEIVSLPANVPSAERLSVLSATTPAVTIEPGKTAKIDLSLFAGPRENKLFAKSGYDIRYFKELIRYEMGCTMCTFQWLAKFLLWFLEVLHVVVADWGVAIIILVLVVRALLHPLTKKAQINMQKMGKQMQLLQPEMEKIKKKYKDNQTKMNQEVMKLYREKGVNPAGMLGCLPMFLQMPIWVALYAMLYFAIELRQEQAFYGVFQFISNGGWHFLQDLSQPDNFIRFSAIGEPGFKLPLYFIEPEFSGINILPLLMAVVFYFQQKLTAPPPANEQAAQQQKMMKFMVLLFPVMLYSAPSGLTLYILASTTAGIVDSYYVRKHIKEQEEAGTLFDKKPRKPGGFTDRIAKRLEAKQQELQNRQANKPKKRK